MHLFFIVLAALTLFAFIVTGIEVTLGIRKMEHLHRVPPIRDEEAPRISVVIPACNEERNIEEALSSVLAQDYPDFEVVAVNDRSTDSTGAILDRIAERDRRVRVLHLRELPKGWLGKNHALQQGAALSNGSLLLFTDADVVMERTVLRRAACYLTTHAIDHLAVPPRALVGGFLSNAFIGLFAFLFSMYTKPWKVRDPKASEFIGIGAFNLVRREAYQRVDGHAPIAMCPDDDLQLGKLLKLHGYLQDMVFGTRLISVEWYASFAEMRHGLMKNMFAGAGYSVARVAAFSLIQVAALVWPFVAIFVTTGSVRVLNGILILLLFLLYRVNAPAAGIDWWWCFTMPIAGCLGVYLLVRATVLTLHNGGIEWRGTKYSLEELRANRI